MACENCQQHNVTGVERLTVKKMAIEEPVVPVVLKISDFSMFKGKKMANGTTENSTHTQEGIG